MSFNTFMGGGCGESVDMLLGEQHMKKLLNRVDVSERSMKCLSEALEEYLSKNLSLTEKGNDVARVLVNFAEKEEFSTSTKLALASASRNLFAVGNTRNLHVRKVEDGILPILSPYKSICRRMTAIVQETKGAFGRVEQQKRRVCKAAEKPHSSAKVEQEFRKSLTDACGLALMANDEMLSFERMRTKDIKISLLAFFRSEMAFHAKALELLTDSFRQVNDVDPEADLQILKTGMALHGIRPLCEPKSSSASKGKILTVPRSSRSLRIHGLRSNRVGKQRECMSATDTFEPTSHLSSYRRRKQRRRELLPAQYNSVAKFGLGVDGHCDDCGSASGSSGCLN